MRPVMDVQAMHAPAVLANQLIIADNWGQPCLGYLLLLQPDPSATAALAQVQDVLLGLEPSMLRQPEYAMHSSVALVVPVFREYDRPKDELWQERGAEWMTAIEEVTRQTAAAGPVRLRFRRLVATDAAIIAVAEEPSLISKLRLEVTAALDLPWPVSRGDLVHLTLFRYRRPLADPGRLLDAVQGMQLAIDIEISELLMVRETTFPSLDFEVLYRLPVRAPPVS
jgi:hypothetical protein